jgi:putative flippase GtrA
MNFISKFTKRDFGFAVLTGLITGVIAWRVFTFLNVPEFHFFYLRCLDSCRGAIPWSSLIIIAPILWILGVLLGYFLGQWFEFFNQFGKFAAIGFTNFFVTLGVLNIFLLITGYASGIGYSAISGASFVVGLLSSYIWNKYWAFHSACNQGGAGEFGKFFVVTIVAFGVNVAVASFVVNLIHPLAGMNVNTWANIGAVVGSAVALVFSFVGFKLVVFRSI